MIRIQPYWILAAVVLVLSGCTGMKHITSEDPLYTGYELKFADKEHSTKELARIANSVVKPAPNNRLMWMRPGVARYNMLSDKAKKRKFWKSKIAEPVVLSQTQPVQVAAAIQNRMFHNGYFRSVVTHETLLMNDRKAKYVYTITLHEPYRFSDIVFPKLTDDLSEKIAEARQESLLKMGDIYSLELVKNERARIDRYLKEMGYIYFNPEFITVRADTVTGDHQVQAVLTVKPETPPESRRPYTIRKVYIHDDYSLDNTLSDTLQFGNYYLISHQNALRFDVLQRGIFLKPGERFAQSNLLHTARYMNGLPIIRNANIRFSRSPSTDELDLMIYLSQRKRLAYSAEFNAIFRSTNYFGPGVVFSYTDRNLKQGAEMLKVNLRGRYEVQIVDGQVNPAYEAGIEVNYQLPRFYPAFLLNTGKTSLPKTNISVGYNLFNRLDLYRLNSVYANFGYRWSRGERSSHSFNPVEVIFTRIPEDSKSDQFRQYLADNPGVQRSFDEQFIVGSGYEYTYQTPAGNRNDFFFRGGIDMAGNILYGLYSATNTTRDSLGSYTLLGVPFSHYVRTRIDLRYGLTLSQQAKLVTRFSAGVGVPLSNSEILPYVKQFFVGGTNSLRSFVARSVGPGSEVPPGGFNDLTGDIRLEGNLEYRFTLSGKLKSALFVDAGNIWLFNEDPSRPNGTFRMNTFLDEIAISSGWGLRWDFEFIVARLDFAYTLRTPHLPPGERWITQFSFWNPAFNIAIGYPF
jgi:outer membrane protein insertion porin family